MANKDVQKKLKSIGKAIFVEYYNDFKNINYDTHKLANKLLKENPNAYSITAQRTRISNARSIFKNNEQISALEEIIISNIEETILAKAKKLLREEMET